MFQLMFYHFPPILCILGMAGGDIVGHIRLFYDEQALGIVRCLLSRNSF
jgi:hypothetical protein